MDAVSEVKARLNIEDVIGEYVQLKRTGRNYKGLSPWTNERTPSFVVSPEKQIWHDFSSGKGGDAFSFVMEVEGLDFKGALEFLARKTGVDLDQFRSAGSDATNAKLKGRTLEALELAAKYYQKQLTVNNRVLGYLITSRHFSKSTILAWRLGYSPNKGTALCEYLTKKGFTADEMKRTGLVTSWSNGLRDMFRGRMMIPLCDGSGAVIGFTARLLAGPAGSQSDAPKYINTPQTIVYDKSRHVFGLHLAKEAIRKTTYVVVVEGNMDVIASYQAGIKNIVASAGTAMTEQHLKTLKRFTGDIRLSFDSDQAGLAATERVIPLAQKTEVNLKIISLTDAKDPDELLHKSPPAGGPKAWQKAIDSAVYAPDWLIEQYKNQLDLSSASGKRVFTDTIMNTLRRLNDPVEQEHYLKKIAKLTETSFEAVKAKFTNQPINLPTLRRAKPQAEDQNQNQVEYQRLQDHFLAMVLMQPKIRSLLKSSQPKFFSEGPARSLLEFLIKNPQFDGSAKEADKLRAIADYVKIITLQFEELYSGLSVNDLEDQASQLKRRLIDRYVKIQKHAISADMKAAKTENEIKRLAKAADELNKLLNL